MAFTSKLLPGERIINDESRGVEIAPPKGKGLGLELARRTTPYGRMLGAPPFPREWLIPRSEWQARIQEMEQTKSRLSDLCTLAGLKCKDQSSTSYCWCNAPTYCVEVLRVAQNQRLVYLSPASCGAPIKGFRNVGGWGQEALEWIVKHGLVPVSKWPANAISRSYYTADNKAIAKQYRVTEWVECVPRNLDEMISTLLMRRPGASGLNHWQHEVSYIDPIWLDGTVAVRHRNSWGMGWGSQGYGILQGSKMLPDDYVVPRVVTASRVVPKPPKKSRRKAA